MLCFAPYAPAAFAAGRPPSPLRSEGGLASGRAARLRGIVRTRPTFYVGKSRERRKQDAEGRLSEP